MFLYCRLYRVVGLEVCALNEHHELVAEILPHTQTRPCLDQIAVGCNLKEYLCDCLKPKLYL